MIINSIDIVNKYGVTIIDKTLGTREVTNYIDWLENSNTPNKVRKEKFKFNEIKVTLLVEAEDKTSLEEKVSNIINDCTNGSLKFDDIMYYYDVTLDNTDVKEICPIASELTLVYKGTYKYLPQVEKQFEAGSKVYSFEYEGNEETPCIIEITPTIGMTRLSIKVTTDDIITMYALEADKTIIIDDKSVTVDGVNKFNDVEMWEFPKVYPGTNKIVLGNTKCNVKVKYNPRFI